MTKTFIVFDEYSTWLTCHTCLSDDIIINVMWYKCQVPSKRYKMRRFRCTRHESMQAITWSAIWYSKRPRRVYHMGTMQWAHRIFGRAESWQTPWLSIARDRSISDIYREAQEFEGFDGRFVHVNAGLVDFDGTRSKQRSRVVY